MLYEEINITEDSAGTDVNSGCGNESIRKFVAYIDSIWNTNPDNELAIPTVLTPFEGVKGLPFDQALQHERHTDQDNALVLMREIKNLTVKGTGVDIKIAREIIDRLVMREVGDGGVKVATSAMKFYKDLVDFNYGDTVGAAGLYYEMHFGYLRYFNDPYKVLVDNDLFGRYLRAM